MLVNIPNVLEYNSNTLHIKKNNTISFHLNKKTLLELREDGIYYNKNDELILIKCEDDMLKSFTIVIEQMLSGSSIYFNHNTPTNFIKKFKKDIIDDFLKNLNIKNSRYLKINQIIK